MSVKAYTVSDVDLDHGAVVVFADTPGHAKAAADLPFTAFMDRRAKRAPELDQYTAKGGPTKEDLRQHGWWFECEHENCYDRVESDCGGVVNGHVYCDEHLPLYREAHEAQPRGS